MKFWKKMSEPEFKKLKQFLSLDVTYASLKEAGVTKRSDQTLQFVKKANSFEEYRKLTQEFYKEKKKPNRTGLTPAERMDIDTIRELATILENINTQSEKALQRLEELV